MGNTYLNSTILQGVPLVYAMDETFPVAHTFTSGANTYNGRTWYCDNLDKAYTIQTGIYEGGLTLHHREGSAYYSYYEDSTRTAPGIRIQLNTLIPNLDLTRQVVYLMADLAKIPLNKLDYSIAFEPDQQTTNANHIRMTRTRWTTDKCIGLHCNFNSVKYSPYQIAQPANYCRGVMLAIGMGQYSGYYRETFTTDPSASGWTFITGNELANMADKSRRWYNGWLYLLVSSIADTTTYMTIMRVTVAYKELY